MPFQLMWHMHFNSLCLYPVSSWTYELYYWMHLHVLEIDTSVDRKKQKVEKEEVTRQENSNCSKKKEASALPDEKGHLI